MSADKSGNRRSNYPLGSPEEEMRARNEIRITEKEREENLERAREVVQLSTELRDAYASAKLFRNLDQKKLERLEKITRRLRSRMGGSDDDDAMLENAPHQVESALKLLVESSEALLKGVEKTPRMVVSANVIERTNDLLQIIRFVRTYTRQP